MVATCWVDRRGLPDFQSWACALFCCVRVGQGWGWVGGAGIILRFLRLLVCIFVYAVGSCWCLWGLGGVGVGLGGRGGDNTLGVAFLEFITFSLSDSCAWCLRTDFFVSHSLVFARPSVLFAAAFGLVSIQLRKLRSSYALAGQSCVPLTPCILLWLPSRQLIQDFAAWNRVWGGPSVFDLSRPSKRQAFRIFSAKFGEKEVIQF